MWFVVGFVGCWVLLLIVLGMLIRCCSGYLGGWFTLLVSLDLVLRLRFLGRLMFYDLLWYSSPGDGWLGGLLQFWVPAVLFASGWLMWVSRVSWWF